MDYWEILDYWVVCLAEKINHKSPLPPRCLIAPPPQSCSQLSKLRSHDNPPVVSPIPSRPLPLNKAKALVLLLILRA